MSLLEQLSNAYAGTGGAYDVVILVILISIIIAGISYGLGRAFRFRQLLNFGKEEFFQQLVSIVLVALLAAFVYTVGTALDELAPEISGVSPHGGANGAINYSIDLIEAESAVAGIILTGLAGAVLVLGALVTIEAGLCIPFTEICLKGPLFLPLLPFYQVLQAFVPTITLFIFLLQAQKALLLFFEVVAFKLFLPLGIIARSFKVTRGIGATFIAMAVGFYIIYPMLFVLNMSLMTAPLEQTANKISNTVSDIRAVTGEEEFNFDNFIEKQDAIETVLTGGGSFIGGAAVMQGMLTSFLATFIIQTFVMPLLCLVLTIILIFEMKEALAADAGLGALNLI